MGIYIYLSNSCFLIVLLILFKCETFIGKYALLLPSYHSNFWEFLRSNIIIVSFIVILTYFNVFSFCIKCTCICTVSSNSSLTITTCICTVILDGICKLAMCILICQKEWTSDLQPFMNHDLIELEYLRKVYISKCSIMEWELNYFFFFR